LKKNTDILKQIADTKNLKIVIQVIQKSLYIVISGEDLRN